MRAVRDRCVWTQQIDHRALVPYLVEESAELIDAVEEGSRAELREELGDLLWQVLFHAEIASRDRGRAVRHRRRGTRPHGEDGATASACLRRRRREHARGGARPLERREGRREERAHQRPRRSERADAVARARAEAPRQGAPGRGASCERSETNARAALRGRAGRRPAGAGRHRPRERLGCRARAARAAAGAASATSAPPKPPPDQAISAKPGRIDPESA